MDKLFEYLESVGVSVIINTAKGSLIPMEQVIEHKLDVATLSPMLRGSGYRISELPKQFRDDPKCSLFIGLELVTDVAKVQSNAKAHLEALKNKA